MAVTSRYRPICIPCVLRECQGRDETTPLQQPGQQDRPNQHFIQQGSHAEEIELTLASSTCHCTCALTRDCASAAVL